MIENESDDYDEWSGRLTLDVLVKFRANTGRPKHTDPEEQGPGFALIVKELLDSYNRHDIQTDIGDVSLTNWKQEDWWDIEALMAKFDPPPAADSSALLMRYMDALHEIVRPHLEADAPEAEYSMRQDLDRAGFKMRWALMELGWEEPGD